MDKIKVCYLINGLGPGGAETMLYRLLQNIDRSIFEPVVIALLKRPGTLAKKIQDTGIPVHIVGVKSKLDAKKVINLYRLLIELKPDILHTQLFASDIIGRVLGKFLNVPLVITSIRNTIFGGKVKEMLIKWTDRYADKTTIICQTAGNRMIQNSIVPKDKLSVIYNGIDIKDFEVKVSKEERQEIRKSLGITTEPFLLLAVAGMRLQKGYPFLLKAVSLLDKNDLKLVIVGDGKMRPNLENQVKELGIENKVNFMGWSYEVPKLMSVADALVLSSIWEGLPGVVLEAMASELPVISTFVGGVPELIVDSENGFLVPSKDPYALAEAIKKVMTMPDEDRKEMGLAGKLKVKKHFSVDKMVASYEQLYIDCLQEKGLLEKSSSRGEKQYDISETAKP